MSALGDADARSVAWAATELGGEVAVCAARSGDQSSVFELSVGEARWFLKLGAGLDAERERLEWIRGRVPVPEVVGFREEERRQALLMTALPGIDLAKRVADWPGDRVVDRLVAALRRLHAVDTASWPFPRAAEPGSVLLHGDACLPNFVFDGEEFGGYVDLGDLSIGDRSIDLSASVWSLDYNLGKGYGLCFLERYGVTGATEEMVESLRRRYAERL